MRRTHAVALTLALMLLGGAAAAQAQAGPVWVRGYPERLTANCIWYVAEWSDNTFTTSPLQCEQGVTIVEQARQTSGGYPQTADNGCVEVVTRWSDDTYTWVPYTCPPGVVYFKAQQRGLEPFAPRAEIGTPVVVVPSVPAAPPPPPGPVYRFRSDGVAAGNNCGLTQLKISVVDVNGAPVNNIRAIVDWEGRQPDDRPITTNPSGYMGYPAGWTDAILRTGPVDAAYRTWLIDDNANQISDVIGFSTNTDCTSPNARQIITITFRATA